MKYSILIFCFVIILNSCNLLNPRNEIPLGDIELLFNEMNKEGIKTNEELLYGYFFIDDDPIKLSHVSNRLSKDGFKKVRMYTDETEQYWLHVERIEVHTPKSLYDLNKKLSRIAESYHIQTYDGFEIDNKDDSIPSK